LAAETLSAQDNHPEAADILKNSRFYRESSPDDPAVFYTLGKIFFNNKEYGRALIEFSKVDKIDRGYRQTEDYLRQLKNISDRRAAKDGKTLP
jgi:hypothetical protein